MLDLVSLMGLRRSSITQICIILSFFLFSAVGFSATRKSCAAILQEQQLPKIDPIILRPLTRLVDDPNNLYEMKYDGFRGVAYFEPGRCRFISKSGKLLSQFQKFCEAISEELHVQNAILDGEVIAPDASGRPIFNKMLRREGPFLYVAFDLLWLNGEDLRPLPLEDRRRRLLELLPESSHLIEASVAQIGSGFKMYEFMVENDLEGIVVKRLRSKYHRTTRWYKYKNRDYSQEVGRGRFFRKR